MQQALAAAVQLEDLGYKANIWSITSFTELDREAQSCERWNRLHPNEKPRQPYVSQLFAEEEGVFIAVTDYIKALTNGIARWIPGPYEVLGTDGYGLSESRENLRNYFEVSNLWIVQAALSALFRNDLIDRVCLDKQSAQLSIDKDKIDSRTRR